MIEDISPLLTLEAFGQVIDQKVLLLDGRQGHFSLEVEEAIQAFVRGGGGLVCIGDAIERYHQSDVFRAIAGDTYGISTPLCEIMAHVTTPEAYITRRVDPSFAVYESLYLLAKIPVDAECLWHTNWQYAPYTLAYTRSYGQGRVFCTTLGTSEETRVHPVFQQMLRRAISYAKGVALEERPARVAMIGYGAIGFEHGTAISNVAGLEYAAVCDRNEARLAVARAAFPGIKTCTNLAEIEADPNIDLVIVSTPPDTHAAISMQMLRAGKHVVSEKPFCLTTAEADAMIALATEYKRTLTVYQCRRWDPDYLAIQEVIRRKTIGPLFHIETFIGGYAHPCDYWHSHEPISGGVFYDWGSHYLDWILQLVPRRVVSVRGVEHKRVWHDVTNADQSSVYLRFADGQEAVFTHSDIAAAMKPKWYILGERGAIVGQWRQESIKTRSWSGDLVETPLAPSEAPPNLLVSTRERNGTISVQHLALPPTPPYAFHRNLASHLHSGELLAVTPQESRRNIVIMDAAKYSAQHGGESVALDC